MAFDPRLPVQQELSAPQAPIGRRRIAAGALWAAPAVMLTTAAPQASASVPPPCVSVYPFTALAPYGVAWTNATGQTVTLTFVTTVPLGSVWNSTIAGMPPRGGTVVAYNPKNPTSKTDPVSGWSFTSTPLSSPSGTLSWTVTTVVPNGVTLKLGTQAPSCRSLAPSATVQVVSPVVDCPFTYKIDCPT